MAYVFISSIWGVCDHCFKFGGFEDPDHCWYNHYAWEYDPMSAKMWAKDAAVAYIPGNGIPKGSYDEVCDTLDAIVRGARV